MPEWSWFVPDCVGPTFGQVLSGQTTLLHPAAIHGASECKTNKPKDMWSDCDWQCDSHPEYPLPANRPTLWRLHPTSSSCQVFLFVFHRPARAAAIYLPWSLSLFCFVLFCSFLAWSLYHGCCGSSYSYGLIFSLQLKGNTIVCFPLTLSPRRGPAMDALLWPRP